MWQLPVPRHHLSIYTENTAELAQLAQRSRAKENASDYIPLFQVVTSHAQTQEENDLVRTSHSDRRNVGESLENRIAENLAATLRINRLIRLKASVDSKMMRYC